MRLRWSEPAAEDLAAIVRYIRQDNPLAARRVAKTIYDACGSLLQFPGRNRPGRENGTRELVLTPLPYILVYRVDGSVVEIFRIWHGAQDR